MKTARDSTMAPPAELPLGEVEGAKIVEVPAPAADLFASLDALRVVPTGAEGALVKQVLSHVPVRKPSKEWFFRIHPEYSLDTLVLELKEDGETSLVSPALQEALLGENCIGIRTLRLGVNRQGTPFVWAVRQPNEGRRDAWASSALDAIHLAQTEWVRMQADMSLGAYRLATARIDDEPRFPKESFEQILRLAFKGAVIDSLDHPTLRKLRGEA